MRDYKEVIKDLNDANSRALKGDFSGIGTSVSDSEIQFLMNDDRMDINGLMNEIGLNTQRMEGQI